MFYKFIYLQESRNKREFYCLFYILHTMKFVGIYSKYWITCKLCIGNLQKSVSIYLVLSQHTQSVLHPSILDPSLLYSGDDEWFQYGIRQRDRVAGAFVNICWHTTWHTIMIPFVNQSPLPCHIVDTLLFFSHRMAWSAYTPAHEATACHPVNKFHGKQN